MKILTFTTLFPNAVQPHHGVFVENRQRYLRASGQVEARVVAPVPWFPFTSKMFGSYGDFARIPAREERHGVIIEHPRYALIPKVGMTLTPKFMYQGTRGTIRRILDEGYDFDVIDAHYFYPDGVAAAMLANEFNKPLTITARGTDLNLIPQYPKPRRMIQWCAERADHMMTVCQALKDSLLELGVADDRVTVLRNGVNLENFVPRNREDSRHRLGIHDDRRLLSSVGHLIERKGHEIVIGAMPHLPDAHLVIVGDGPEDAALKALAVELGVEDRVDFLGRRPHEELSWIYSASDALVLASSREGWANVLLEAMACGTPVVASNIWGTPEVVTAPEAGRLMADRTPKALADAAKDLFGTYPDRAMTRAYAERFSWDDTTEGQLRIFGDLMESAKSV
ncbi:glycosyltransferase family 4 protein [Magnetospira sp. QH-2]|uniref:glycosyltransferase family 4 protein n=1 Tax=Magnetospira sp. (strain QH-2) TaxID=1288970 RepID=UPI0003E817BE|nr:glycosyltransferase family 4 protein [Magnetospira sp. QH-2]CCQ73101.1 putative GT4 : distantly related to UDP-GlcNAc: 1L-myo-inositol-1-P a-N-acetylglucoaminyltransferase [Magnetospira sp. QH-2]